MKSETVRFGFVPTLPACCVESQFVLPGQFLIWITWELLIAAPFGVTLRYFELFMAITNIIQASLGLFHPSPTAQSPHLPSSQCIEPCLLYLFGNFQQTLDCSCVLPQG